MDSVSKRRNIIVGIAVLAVIYGLYDITTSSQKKNNAAHNSPPEELQTFIDRTTADMRGSERADFYAYVVGRAERPWSRNLFAQKTSGGKQLPVFSYTGHMEAGGRAIAIVDGVEYQEGGQLEKNKRYFVKQIFPFKVIIGDRQAKTEFEVPLHE
jgi:hypothetical protein